MRREFGKLRADPVADAIAGSIGNGESNSLTNPGAKPVGNFHAFGRDQVGRRGANASLSSAITFA